MKSTALALAGALLLAPAVSHAHGQAPAAAHGGQVQDAHGDWIELVVSGDRVEVWVSDEHGKPTPASQISGTATVLVDGQPQKVQLSPAEGNELTGRLPQSVSGGAAATVSLRIGGRTATARFAAAG